MNDVIFGLRIGPATNSCQDVFLLRMDHVVIEMMMISESVRRGWRAIDPSSWRVMDEVVVQHLNPMWILHVHHSSDCPHNFGQNLQKVLMIFHRIQSSILLLDDHPSILFLYLLFSWGFCLEFMKGWSWASRWSLDWHLTIKRLQMKECVPHASSPASSSQTKH